MSDNALGEYRTKKGKDQRNRHGAVGKLSSTQHFCKSAATKMPYTTVYLHIHAMCSRKLNTFNNQIIDLSKSFGNIHLPATHTQCIII